MEHSKEAGESSVHNPLRGQIAKLATLVMGKPDPRPDSDYSPDELREGVADEKEHTPSIPARKEITKDHLDRDPKYYDHEEVKKKLFEAAKRLGKVAAANEPCRCGCTERNGVRGMNPNEWACADCGCVWDGKVGNPANYKGNPAFIEKKEAALDLAVPQLPAMPSIPNPMDHVEKAVLKDVRPKDKSRLRTLMDRTGLTLAAGGAVYGGARLMTDESNRPALEKLVEMEPSITNNPDSAQSIRDYVTYAAPAARHGTLFGIPVDKFMHFVRSVPGHNFPWKPGDQHHYDMAKAGPLSLHDEFVASRLKGNEYEIPGYETDHTAGSRYYDAYHQMASATAKSLGLDKPVEQMTPEEQDTVYSHLHDYWKTHGQDSFDLKEKAESLIGAIQQQGRTAYGYAHQVTRPLLEIQDLGKKYVGPAMIGAGLGGIGLLAYQIMHSRNQHKEEKGKKMAALATSYRSLLKAKLKHQEALVHTAPTEAQKRKGNYRMGHVFIQGLDVSIESPKGSTRRGVTKDGVKWETKMKNSYGYIRNAARSEADGDHVDVFIGTHPDSEVVFVIDQIEPSTGKFDEHKCMVGFLNEKDARDAYAANYQKGWKGFDAITSLTMDQFKKWIIDGDTGKRLAGQQMSTFFKTANLTPVNAILAPLWMKPSLAGVALGGIEGAAIGAGIGGIKKLRNNIFGTPQGEPEDPDLIQHHMVAGAAMGAGASGAFQMMNPTKAAGLDPAALRRVIETSDSLSMQQKQILLRELDQASAFGVPLDPQRLILAGLGALAGILSGAAMGGPLGAFAGGVAGGMLGSWVAKPDPSYINNGATFQP